MIFEQKKLYENRNDVTLSCYIWEDSPELLEGKTRPAVIVCPGGAYLNCSDREAEPVAMKFLSMGYHVFVLRYSVYMEGKGGFPDFTGKMERKEHCIHPIPMREIAESMLYIKQNADRWLVDTNRIALCGFSAGAHNCAMYAVHWNKPVITDIYCGEKAVFKPIAVILAYPLTDYVYMQETMEKDMIMKGLFTISNTAFLGDAEVTQERLEAISPARQVTEDTPPMFIWATAADNLVPVQHSLRMAHALADKKIPYELHIFEEGDHGFAVADQTSASAQSEINQDVQNWVILADKWLKKRMTYDLPQYTKVEQMVMNGEISLP